MTRPDALTRFSSRVADYVRYRPGYPALVYRLLADEHGLRSAAVVADVGSGTGISARVFLEHGHTVLGVEPNAEMRAAAEQLLAQFAGFRSVSGRAEATTLDAGSVDWVIAAQAFHWFDVDACRVEFRRILRAGGRIALLWNDRRCDTPFLREYEVLLQNYATDYREVDHRQVESDGRIERLFGGAPRRAIFENVQVFDFDGLRGRLLSSSYAPGPGHARHEPMLAALRELFERHERDGVVRVHYDTKLFVSG